MATESSGKNKAAIGLKAHSGWAALVAVAGTINSPIVIERRRISMADPQIAGPVQPYHQAEGMPIKVAERLINDCRNKAIKFAVGGLKSATADIVSKGYDVANCVVLLGTERKASSLEAILASHALIHAAEGDLFRQVLIEAAERCGLQVSGTRERDLYSQASSAFGIVDEQVQRLIAEIGKKIGPPWQQDQKNAALAAWLLLADL